MPTFESINIEKQDVFETIVNDKHLKAEGGNTECILKHLPMQAFEIRSMAKPIDAITDGTAVGVTHLGCSTGSWTPVDESIVFVGACPHVTRCATFSWYSNSSGGGDRRGGTQGGLGMG